ncbi:UNVERIFIED_CONTAM: hypothetical protein Slati_4142500 [Sesamum latifolium]|uniref:Uncharacterized protein n=1 Tax=Sesamum latifolium TaxID=2727402 RepID=A0AAW2TBQ7_9LAMI
MARGRRRGSSGLPPRRGVSRPHTGRSPPLCFQNPPEFPELTPVPEELESK